MIKSIKNSEHYHWGNHCEGWQLLKTDDLNVVQEQMPPGTSEHRHSHIHSQQLCYVLSGVAMVEVDGDFFQLEPGESIHIPRGSRHCIANKGKRALSFLVISEPKSHGDSINV